MPSQLPDDIEGAEQLLKKFSKNKPISDKKRTSDTIFQAFQILDAHLERNPNSARKQYLLNLKKSYTRELLRRLHEFVPREKEDFDFSRVLLNLVVYCSDEMQKLLAEDPGGIRQFFDEAMINPEITDLIGKFLSQRVVEEDKIL